MQNNQEKLVVNANEIYHDDDLYYYYKGELFTGIEEWFYDTGELGSIIEYKNGIKDGWAYSYFKDGKLSKKTFYRDGRVSGMNEIWYPNGQPKVQREIYDGKSIWEKEWDEKGNLILDKKRQQ